jgi:phosphopantetheine--protein transferase-like protein
MPTDVLIEYLSTLLNRPVSVGESVSLSSAQRARFIGWLEVNGRAVGSGAIPAQFEVSELARSLGVMPAPSGGGSSRRPTSGPVTAAMVRGVGIDIQSVAELVKPEAINDLKNDAELRAMFTLRELSYAADKGNSAETLAGLFAAKEAIRKADPDMLPQALSSIEILPDAQGAPRFPGFAISISHSAGFAVAIAIATPTGALDPPEQVGNAGFGSQTSPSPSDVLIPAVVGAGWRPGRARQVGVLVTALLLGAGAAGIAWLHALTR